MDRALWRRWLKRAGALGVLFFLLKGIAWLALAGAVVLGLR
jgi:hypothetical protein